MGHLSSDEDLGMIHESELMKSAIPSLGILKCGTYGGSEVVAPFSTVVSSVVSLGLWQGRSRDV